MSERKHQMPKQQTLEATNSGNDKHRQHKISAATNVGRIIYAGSCKCLKQQTLAETSMQELQTNIASIKFQKLQYNCQKHASNERSCKLQKHQMSDTTIGWSNVRLYNWKHQMSDSTIGSIKCQTLQSEASNVRLYVQSEASNVRLYNWKHQFCPDYSQFCPDYSQFCPDYPRDRIPPPWLPPNQS